MNNHGIEIDSDLLARTDITSTRKLILAYLVMHDDMPDCEINPTDISLAIGVCYKTAYREIKELKEMGIIE